LSNTITYKNYIGTVEYSSEDKCFFGKVEFINDLVTFEGTSVEELEVNFQDSVDDYMLTCKEVGKKPEKTFTGVFNIRPGAKLHMRAAKKALELGVSLNAYIQNLISNDAERLA